MATEAEERAYRLMKEIRAIHKERGNKRPFPETPYTNADLAEAERRLNKFQDFK